MLQEGICNKCGPDPLELMASDTGGWPKLGSRNPHAGPLKRMASSGLSLYQVGSDILESHRAEPAPRHPGTALF